MHGSHTHSARADTKNTDKMSSRLASGRGATSSASADAAAIKVENRVLVHTSYTRIRPAPDTAPPLPSFGRSQPANHEQEPGGNAFQG